MGENYSETGKYASTLPFLNMTGHWLYGEQTNMLADQEIRLALARLEPGPPMLVGTEETATGKQTFQGWSMASCFQLFQHYISVSFQQMYNCACFFTVILRKTTLTTFIWKQWIYQGRPQTHRIYVRPLTIAMFTTSRDCWPGSADWERTAGDFP